MGGTHYTLNYINPKEKKRLNDENDTSAGLHQPYCDIRIRPVEIDYPCLTDINFSNRTGLKKNPYVTMISDKFTTIDVASAAGNQDEGNSRLEEQKV